MNKEKEAIAYHEAGHAMMFIAYFKRFRYVTIIPEPGRTLGHLMGYKMHPQTVAKMEYDLNFNRAIEEVMCSWAGKLTEEKFLGKKVKAGFYGDFSNMAEFVGGLIQDVNEQHAFYKWIQIRTQGIIDARWKEIEAIAKALLRRKKLSYKEVFEVVMSVASGKPD